jgi:hypothetical protein
MGRRAGSSLKPHAGVERQSVERGTGVVRPRAEREYGCRPAQEPAEVVITPEGGRDVRHLRAHGVGRWVKPLASDSVSKPLRRECVLGTAPDTLVSFGCKVQDDYDRATRT